MNATGQHATQTPRREVYPLPVAFRVEVDSPGLATVGWAWGCSFSRGAQVSRLFSHWGSVRQSVVGESYYIGPQKCKRKRKGFRDAQNSRGNGPGQRTEQAGRKEIVKPSPLRSTIGGWTGRRGPNQGSRLSDAKNVREDVFAGNGRPVHDGRHQGFLPDVYGLAGLPTGHPQLHGPSVPALSLSTVPISPFASVRNGKAVREVLYPSLPLMGGRPAPPLADRMTGRVCAVPPRRTPAAFVKESRP